MIDIINQINTTQREIGNQAVATGEGRSVLLRRVYDAPIEDVWSACTDSERLGRWLGPVDGDLRELQRVLGRRQGETERNHRRASPVGAPRRSRPAHRERRNDAGEHRMAPAARAIHVIDRRLK